MFELPKEKTSIKKNIYEYNWLIYGQPKIGKSSYVSQFGDPLFIATEDRLKALNVFKVPAEGCLKSWEEFISVSREIYKAVKANNFPYSCIVIDTVDNLMAMCSDKVCKDNDMEHPSDKAYGKGWQLITKEFFRIISIITSLGVGVVFISHAEEKTFKTRIMETTKIVPSVCSGKAGKMLLAMVDIVAYVGFDKTNHNERAIYFRGNENLEAGDTTGHLPEKCTFDFTEVEKHFNKIEDKKEIEENG